MDFEEHALSLWLGMVVIIAAGLAILAAIHVPQFYLFGLIAYVVGRVAIHFIEENY